MSENHAPDDKGADSAPTSQSSNASTGKERVDRMEKLLELQARLKRLTDEANQGQESQKGRRRPGRRSLFTGSPNAPPVDQSAAEVSTAIDQSSSGDTGPVAVEEPPPTSDGASPEIPAIEQGSTAKTNHRKVRATADSFAAALRESVRGSREPRKESGAPTTAPSPAGPVTQAAKTIRAPAWRRRAAERAEGRTAAPDRASLGDRIGGAIRAAANPLRTRINGQAKSGDPVKPEELTRSRGVGLRLLGAVVSGLALAVVGVGLLIQTGKVADPRSSPSDLLPATASGTGFVPSLLREESTPGATPETPAETPPDAADGETPPVTSNIPPEQAGQGAGSPAADGVAAAAIGFVGPPVEPPAQEIPEFVLDFARLQGDLAFRLGEYEMMQSEFERGEVACDGLAVGFERVDRAHLLLARLVARWPEKPRRQAAAYEELSSLTDTVNRQFGESGCAAP